MDTLPTITTERTNLRVLAPAEARLLHAYRLANRAHLAQWEPQRDEAWYTEQATAQHLQRTLDESLAGTSLHLEALDRVSGDMVAHIQFTNIVRGAFQACHIGYSVLHTQQGTGLMTEVARAAIRHVFQHLGLHRIMANHVPHNTRSEALLRRLGFEREGYARAYLHINGQWQDMVLNSLINEP